MPITFWNQERLANTTTSGSQFEPTIAVLPDGGTVVAWTDIGPNPEVVRIQRFDAFGTPVGSETTIGTATGSSGSPQIAVLPDGRYAVAWMSSGPEISLQRFQANGALDGGPMVVTSNAFAFTSVPFDVIGLANNTYALVYASQTVGERDVALRVISGAGVVGGEIVVDNLAGSSQSTPYLSATASNILVTWFDGSANSGDIQARRFSLTGGSPTAEVTVNTTTTGFQVFSPVALLTTQDHVVIWSDGAALRGQIVDSAGNRIGSEFLVALDATSGDVAAVAATQEGGFVVVYRTTAGSVVAQAFNSLGVTEGVRIRIADSVVNSNVVDVSTLPDGRIAVTWAGTAAADGSGTGVFTRILDPRDGVVSGDVNANTLYGNDFRGDQISGFGGNDTMFGLGGDDVMFGGDGNDTMAGGAGHDMLFGEIGGDTMSGAAGNDNMDGGAGYDTALWEGARSNYFVRSFVSNGQVFTQVS
ncbi:MAG: calcium-binding protein, partial [Phreatobacter sp.]|uniref:calcium-binding protein n=1 Tax=Phreatobacter sp. TaxID=1966341 RepID=UPI002734AE0A